MENKIELVTFANNKDQIALSIKAGIDHLILEDSKVCIRSYSEDFNKDDFGKLADLAHYSRSLNPKIILSANCDLLIHERHLNRIQLFIKSVKAANIPTIRIQDIGMIPLIKEIYPTATIHLNPEIGHHNKFAIAHFSKLVSRQVLSNELTAEEIKAVTDYSPGEYEVQVQGPILIQYSNRRYLSGLSYTSNTGEIESHPSIIRTTQDQDYKQRFYRFYDNAHGHMMFLYFDRCLIRYIPELIETGCQSWLIDGRGESTDYLIDSISLYKRERDLYSASTSKEAFFKLQSVGQRPQKAGFFRANMNDQRRKSYTISPPEGTVYAGKIVDLKKPSVVALECETPISIGDRFIYSNPKGESLEYTLTQLHSLNHETIQTSDQIKTKHRYPIVLIKWQKGMAVKSKLYKAIS